MYPSGSIQRLKSYSLKFCALVQKKMSLLGSELRLCYGAVKLHEGGSARTILGRVITRNTFVLKA